MSVHAVTPLGKGCPWENWSRPNIKWCEENLCAWITTPANTWSNLTYIFFGIWMIYDAKKRKSETLSLVGVASILVGITSFVYHATYTAQGQFLDFVGMFMFASIPIVLNGRRLQLYQKTQEHLVGGSIILLLSLLTALIQLEVISNPRDFPIQLLVAALILITVVQEIILFFKDNYSDRRQFFRSIFFIAAGFSCSIMDAKNVWCDPKNHLIQGHAAWHVLSSMSLQFIYLFYAQFDLTKDPLLPMEKARQ